MVELFSLCVALMLTVAEASDSGNAAAKANNAFGVDLYKQLSVGEGNLFFSPLSLSSALAMAHAGANGATADEMAKVLHLDAGADVEFGALLKGIQPQGLFPPYRLSVANALWMQKEDAFLKPFLSTAREQYEAGLFKVDFAGAPEEARKKINRWAEKQTDHKIRGFIAPGQLDGELKLLLANAVYFKGDWEHPFNKERTVNDEFHISSDRVVRVPMMKETISILGLKDDGVQVVSLPYEGKRLAMLVVLPDALDGLKAVEAGLSAERLNEWIATVSEHDLNVTLPRFKASSEFDLKPELSAMGMSTAFGPTADFSRMTGGKGSFISEVLHKSYVDVDEEGTEAMSFTIFKMKGAFLSQSEFKVDHPFLYAIYDKTTGAVLFLGRMMDPTAS